MSLEDEFNKDIEELEQFMTGPERKEQSLLSRKMDCPAYHRIISMGEAAFPLIKKLYDKDKKIDEELKSFGLTYIVENIAKTITAKEFRMPSEAYWNRIEIEKYTKKWLDEYLSKP